MSPDDCIDKFERRIDRAVNQYDELLLSVHNKRTQSSLESTLSEQFMMNVVVSWESFLNDVIAAHIFQSPNKYHLNLESRIDASIKSKFGEEINKHVNYSKPPSISFRKLVLMLDPKGRNLTYPDISKLSTFANDVLPPIQAMKFSFNQSDTQFINLIYAIRNVLAHNSRNSKDNLNRYYSEFLDQHGNASHHNNMQYVGNIRYLNTYLKTDINGSRRVKHFASRLKIMANSLR